LERLGEIALFVEQPHGDEAGALVARRLAVVPGEYPEAPGVDGKALVEAVLGAEVGNERRIRGRRAVGKVGVLGLERPVIARQALLVACAAVERGLVDAAQRQAGIAAGLLPQLGIEILEQRARRPMPAEKQVA